MQIWGKRNTLKYYMLAPFLIGTTCLVLFLMIYTYSSTYRVVENAMINIASVRTGNTVGSISMLMNSLRSRAQELVSDPGVLNVLMDHDKKGQSPDSYLGAIDVAGQTSLRLEAITEGYRYFRDILLLDKDGLCIASSNESYVGINYAGEEYVKEALAGHYYLGNFSVGRVTKNFSVYFSAPIDIHGKLDGVLIIISDFPCIIQYETSDEFISQALSTSMLTPQGMYMAHENIRIMGNSQPEYQQIYEQLFPVGERGGYVEYVQDGEQYVGVAMLEPNTRWLVIASGLKHEVFASAYRTGIVVLLVTLFFCFAVCAVVVRYASRVLDALISLIRYAKHVSEGNLNVRLTPTDRTDELGVLHNSLENLVSTLQEMFQERQKADRMKDEFLANMSHEIRTPLNAIMGMTHLAEQENTDSGKRKLYLKRIKVAADSLLGIINDILDISKVEAGKMIIESNVFHLKEMVEDTMGIHHEAARAKGLSLLFDCDSSTHPHYMGDSMRIRQVLNNLLSNAIKFTEQGQISIRCWEEPSDSRLDKARLYFQVTDTGMGISDELISKLFQPFTQADASVTRKFGGTGLGLAICRRLVMLMDGEIWLESTINEGSVFTFYLTLSIAGGVDVKSAYQEKQQASIPEDMSGIANKKILLAEDNDINQVIFKELLMSLGVQVTAVSNGQEAVEAVEKEKFHLILIDMQMPVMGGLEATRIIREMKEGKDVTIIALTANARSEDRMEAQNAGMNDYLTKPIDPPLFIQTVRKWLLATS